MPTVLSGLGFAGCVPRVEFSQFLGALLCPANWSLDLKYGEIQVWVLF